MGLPAETIAALQAADADEQKGFPVWPANMPIVDAFLAVASQWRATGLADGRVLWLGLDYAGVRAGLRELGQVLSPAQWRALASMERDAANALNGR